MNDSADPSPSHNIIEEAFGRNCNLYTDVLQCSKDVDKAGLRKAYYRAALQHHPDRHQNNPDLDHDSMETHKRKFQAISLAYQVLCNEELRAEYDETGVIPGSDVDEEENDFSAWKDYFRNIFGSVTVSKIDAFASKYKCSEEERRDVLKQFVARKGNLVKVLEFVMLSEPRDVKRWVEDFIEPAFAAGELDPTKLRATMEKSLKQCEKMAEKENQQEDDDDCIDSHDEQDDDATETEESETDSPPKKVKSPPKKAQKSQAKHQSRNKKNKGDMDSLVAAIQNKRHAGATVFANIAMRYGGKLEEDPLSDEAFARTQSKLKQGSSRR